ncbi:MAG: hypothetical protein PHI31_17875 [Desulfuromonadaceae bacterium]|nr:hypothetical protein [Desulfuromonadaceae bacterium]
MTKADIIAVLDSPDHLETLYRSDPERFRRSFPDALAQHPDSLVLKIWQERLKPLSETASERQPLWLMLSVIIVTALLFRLSAFSIGDDHLFEPKLFFPLLLTGQIVYFLTRLQPQAKRVWWVLSLAAACFLFSLLLPEAPPDSYVRKLFEPNNTDADVITLSRIHLPLVFWSLLGVAFCGQNLQSTVRRMQYLRFWGETLIYTTMILLGGVVLSTLAIALFHLIEVDIFKWYFQNIVVIGLISAPLVATYVADVLTAKQPKLTSLLANLFSPLFLLLVAGYLVAMAIQHTNPVVNRDALISFNGLLLIVLAITVFSLSDQNASKQPRWLMLVNIGLIAVTLLIDAIALTAITVRLASMGFTPNRITVLGANLLVFIHLIGLLHGYWSTLKDPGHYARLEQWIAGYLPVYSVWSIAVTFGFPLLYGVF